MGFGDEMKRGRRGRRFGERRGAYAKVRKVGGGEGVTHDNAVSYIGSTKRTRKGLLSPPYVFLAGGHNIGLDGRLAKRRVEEEFAFRSGWSNKTWKRERVLGEGRDGRDTLF